MGSSFEDLIASSPTVKTDFESNKRFNKERITPTRNFIISTSLALNLTVQVCSLVKSIFRTLGG
jgi:hypothetical protein